MPIIVDSTIHLPPAFEDVQTVINMTISNASVGNLTPLGDISPENVISINQTIKDDAPIQTAKNECQSAEEKLNKALLGSSIKTKDPEYSSRLFELHNGLSACQINWVDKVLAPFLGKLENVTDAKTIKNIFEALKESTFHNHENIARETKIRKHLETIKNHHGDKIAQEDVALLLSLNSEMRFSAQVVGDKSPATTSWVQGKEGVFTLENVQSMYHVTHAENAGDKPFIIIAPGRGEPMEVYKELAMELKNNGFHSLVLGFQGNGDVGSSGHIEHFNDYSNAINHAVNLHEDMLGVKQQDIVLIGHSTGGTAVLDYLQSQPSPLIKQVHLITPMLEINQSSINMNAATFVDDVLTKSTDFLNGALSYLPGDVHFAPPKLQIPGETTAAFSENELTQSPVRYRAITQIKQTHPQGAPKKPTFHWVAQAKKTTDKINARHNETPKDIDIFIYTAGNDSVVKSATAKAFAQKIKATHIPILGAEHSLLQEADPYRMRMVHGIIERISTDSKLN